MAGRRTVRTPENAAKIEQAIEAGLTHKLAAAYAGMSDDTFYRWRAADADFAARIDAAEARGALACVARIRQAAPDDWRAAAWILEHRHKEAFGKRTEVAGKLEVDHVLREIAAEAADALDLDPAEVLAEVHRHLKAGAG